MRMPTWRGSCATEHAKGAYTCVMHCFSSSAELARTALDLGFYLSMSGITAFPKSGDLRDIFAAAPHRADPGRNRQPLSRPAAAPRAAQRACLHRSYRAAGGGDFRHDISPNSQPRRRRISTGCLPRRPPMRRQHERCDAHHHPWLRLLRGVCRVWAGSGGPATHPSRAIRAGDVPRWSSGSRRRAPRPC